MRTTLNIDDDVLRAVKEIAKLRGNSAGAILSELARESLERNQGQTDVQVRNGVPLLPARPGAGIVTREAVMYDPGPNGFHRETLGAIGVEVGLDRYCVHVESENLIDGTVIVSHETCIDADDVRRGLVPVSPDGGLMDGRMTATYGCSAVVSRSGAPSGQLGGPPLFALLAIALFLRRRARHAG